MAVYRRSSRPRFVLIVLLLVAVTLVTIDARATSGGTLGGVRGQARDVFSPLQRATHAVLEPIGNFLSGAVHYGSLRKENEQLRNEITNMEATNAQAAAAQAEADQILSLQHLPFLGAIPTVDAEVVDQGADNFETTITVDKGSASGVAVGQPVVVAGGLVGSVAEVGRSTSTIELLTDPSFAVGVRLDALNTGSAQGSGRDGPLRVTIDTPEDAPPKLSKGEAVDTSGLSLEKFPPGIPVGRVASATTPAGASEPDIVLRPLVNLDKVTAVSILLWSPQ